jgi:hypothetical protein
LKKYIVYFGMFGLLLLSGCGYYSMAGSIPPHIKSIAIPIVKNQTAEFGVAEGITDNIIEVFNEENILRITNTDDADSVLKGIIISLEDAPYTFNSEEAVSEYRITIAMDITWYDVRNEVDLLSKRYTGWGAYGLSGDINTDGIDNDGDGKIDDEDDDEFGEPREFATKIAITKISEDVVNNILTAW